MHIIYFVFHYKLADHFRLNILAFLSVYIFFGQRFTRLQVEESTIITNKSLHSLILQFSHDSTSSTDKLFLTTKMQKQLGLSIGNISLLKMCLFLTIVGTMFTYILLIKSETN